MGVIVAEGEVRTLGGMAGTPGQGPYIVMTVKVQEDTIVAAQFSTYGCPSSIACGRWVAEWAPGRSIAEAMALEPGEVASGVGGLPLGKEFTASLAVNALRDAVGGGDTG